MTLVVQTPDRFFYDLLNQSSKKHRVNVEDEVKVYLIKLLSALVADANMVELEKALSIMYLQACQDKDKDALKLVGDTCLFQLGLYPMLNPSNHSLYAELGPSSYRLLVARADVYGSLSRDFSKVVDLLLGANMLLNDDVRHKCNIWWSTKNPLVKDILEEDNIVPLKGF